ncbi:MAG: lipopolysaccharide biosynthesis protein [Clostridia bacterium]|nr:lipopolysaccharide biosynthesis protein [Clostridia bacterium]
MGKKGRKLPMQKWLYGEEKNRTKNSFLWNSVSGMINALQSTFILFFIQRVASTDVSGVFIIAFAAANLLQNIGRYGVRYFQASDEKGKYSFDIYFTQRMYTCMAMMVAAVLYCVFQYAFGQYTVDKALVCFLMCAQKLIDCIEDVFLGELHRNGKLDIAGRVMTVRLLAVIISFLAIFVASRNLVLSTLGSVVVGTAAMLYLLNCVRGEVRVSSVMMRSPAVKTLTRDCFPLFSGAFLLMFIVNIPKFAIDAVLTSSDQAVYGFISMPIFIVALLAEFVFRPMTNSLTTDWWEGNLKAFKKRVLYIIFVIVGITVVCVVGGVVIGLPVLSIAFNYPLKSQWIPFAILLVGSGLLSMTSFQAMVLTIIREQKSVILSYLPSAIISIPLCALLVRSRGLLGAAVSYAILVALMLACVTGFLGFYIHKREREKQ